MVRKENSLASTTLLVRRLGGVHRTVLKVFLVGVSLPVIDHITRMLTLADSLVLSLSQFKHKAIIRPGLTVIQHVDGGEHLSGSGISFVDLLVPALRTDSVSVLLSIALSETVRSATATARTLLLTG